VHVRVPEQRVLATAERVAADFAAGVGEDRSVSVRDHLSETWTSSRTSHRRCSAAFVDRVALKMGIVMWFEH
jgi:hypothetical protein